MNKFKTAYFVCIAAAMVGILLFAIRYDSLQIETATPLAMKHLPEGASAVVLVPSIVRSWAAVNMHVADGMQNIRNAWFSNIEAIISAMELRQNELCVFSSGAYLLDEFGIDVEGELVAAVYYTGGEIFDVDSYDIVIAAKVTSRDRFLNSLFWNQKSTVDVAISTKSPTEYFEIWIENANGQGVLCDLGSGATISPERTRISGSTEGLRLVSGDNEAASVIFGCVAYGTDGLVGDCGCDRAEESANHCVAKVEASKSIDNDMELLADYPESRSAMWGRKNLYVGIIHDGILLVSDNMQLVSDALHSERIRHNHNINLALDRMQKYRAVRGNAGSEVAIATVRRGTIVGEIDLALGVYANAASFVVDGEYYISESNWEILRRLMLPMNKDHRNRRHGGDAEFGIEIVDGNAAYYADTLEMFVDGARKSIGDSLGDLFSIWQIFLESEPEAVGVYSFGVKNNVPNLAISLDVESNDRAFEIIHKVQAIFRESRDKEILLGAAAEYMIRNELKEWTVSELLEDDMNFLVDEENATWQHYSVVDNMPVRVRQFDPSYFASQSSTIGPDDVKIHFALPKMTWNDIHYRLKMFEIQSREKELLVGTNPGISLHYNNKNSELWVTNDPYVLSRMYMGNWRSERKCGTGEDTWECSIENNRKISVEGSPMGVIDIFLGLNNLGGEYNLDEVVYDLERYERIRAYMGPNVGNDGIFFTLELDREM